ncbi:hypothetical protein BC939DRAFT_74962 [Gamsiella multidivaricata]|uniref:uncharacterized protein n=1 Tax=Gamsiella multidivaricata TaxID=101098 RepID=UPI00221ED54E|nr:uncharacterized protein BC939DRAFT_74962 [Gamsiella multidivaricata]KAI7815899.1 hypothetical protein BC939DRAFT_74962 [Gamsiella multidivaricata]
MGSEMVKKERLRGSQTKRSQFGMGAQVSQDVCMGCMRTRGGEVKEMKMKKKKKKRKRGYMDGVSLMGVVVGQRREKRERERERECVCVCVCVCVCKRTIGPVFVSPFCRPREGEGDENSGERERERESVQTLCCSCVFGFSSLMPIWTDISPCHPDK